MKIKLFGERNTGTNALLQMLKTNSKSEFYPGTMSELSSIASKEIALLQKLGLSAIKKEEMIDKVFFGRGPLERWKHSATNFNIDQLDESKFIFTVRDPMSWLVSLFKNPYHILIDKPDNLVSFAEVKWRTLGRENVVLNFYKPLDLLQEKLKSYLGLMEQLEKKNFMYKVVKFEDFVVNQHATFDSLRTFLDVPSLNFVEFTASTKEKTKDSKYYASYYANQIWKDEFPEVLTIKNTISKELLSTFGY
jgi:hypothetical protein